MNQDYSESTYDELFVKEVIITYCGMQPDAPVIPPVEIPNSPASITITGIAEVGETLAALVVDVNGVPTTVTYQWLANGINIPGANSINYIVKESDAGKAITVSSVFIDNAGFNESVQTSITIAEIVKIPLPDYLLDARSIDSIGYSIQKLEILTQG